MTVSAIGSNRQRRLALIVLTTLWLLIDATPSASESPKSVSIELRRKRSLLYNGIEVRPDINQWLHIVARLMISHMRTCRQ